MLQRQATAGEEVAALARLPGDAQQQGHGLRDTQAGLGIRFSLTHNLGLALLCAWQSIYLQSEICSLL